MRHVGCAPASRKHVTGPVGWDGQGCGIPAGFGFARRVPGRLVVRAASVSLSLRPLAPPGCLRWRRVGARWERGPWRDVGRETVRAACRCTAARSRSCEDTPLGAVLAPVVLRREARAPPPRTRKGPSRIQGARLSDGLPPPRRLRLHPRPRAHRHARAEWIADRTERDERPGRDPEHAPAAH
jgi:hypothetical protein